MAVVAATAAARLLSYMERTDHDGTIGVAPNASDTGWLLFASVLLFWVPLLGQTLLAYSLYRSRWLTLSDWVYFLLAWLLLVSFSVTLAWAIFMAVGD